MKSFIKTFLNGRKKISGETADFVQVERAERIFYLETLREGMTVFDVGANIGELTLLFSRFVGDAGNVHAFEAASATFENLESVCRIAGRRNVHLNHLALADTKKTIRLNVYDEILSGFNSEANRPLKDYGIDAEPLGVEEISATTIDEYCFENKIKKIDLLKIDVEGAEFQVMKGARKMLESKQIEFLTFEFGQTTFDMENRAEEIENFLAEMNYKIRNIVTGDEVFPGRERVETARYSMHVAEPI